MNIISRYDNANLLCIVCTCNGIRNYVTLHICKNACVCLHILEVVMLHVCIYMPQTYCTQTYMYMPQTYCTQTYVPQTYCTRSKTLFTVHDLLSTCDRMYTVYTREPKDVLGFSPWICSCIVSLHILSGSVQCMNVNVCMYLHM